MEDLPKGDTPIPEAASGLMRLTVNPKWKRHPILDGWYLFRFSYSSPQEAVRVVQCRNLGHDSDVFDLGFSIEHEAMGCIHRNKDQKEFWFAYIDLNNCEHNVNQSIPNSPDSEATENIYQGDASGAADFERWARGGKQI